MSWKKSFNNRYLFDLLSNNSSELADLTLNNIMDNFYDSAMNTSTDGKFKAVCLSGIRTESNTGEGPDANDAQLTGDYISIIVRPLTPFGDILPDPRKFETPSLIDAAISLCGSCFTARSDYTYSATNSISFAQVIDCYFEKGSVRNSDFITLRFSEPQDNFIETSYENLATISGERNIVDSNWSSASLLGVDNSEGQPKAQTATYVGKDSNFRDSDVENGNVPNNLLGKATKGSINKPTMMKEIASNYDRLAVAFGNKFPGKQLGAWGYRSYEDQVSLKKKKPKLAATPGTSRHGWGLAIDIHYFQSGIRDAQALEYSSDEYKWLDANAPKYGWVNPQWARENNANKKSKSRKEEPWHWEWSNINSILRGIK